MSIPSQLSSSSSYKITDQISKACVQSCTTLPSKTPNCDKVLATADLRLHIFTFLPPAAAVNACRLNKAWRMLENNELLWQVKFSQDVRDGFAPLIAQNKNVIEKWKNVCLYTRLAPFVDNIIESEHSRDDFILSRNPELNDLLPPDRQPYIYMPKPSVQYGDCHLAICNLKNITVEVHDGKRIPKIFLLQGEEGTRFIHLAVEGDDVFALSQSGLIFHWNYKTGARKENISTAYSKGSEKFKQENRAYLDTSFCHEFYIKNGIIVMTYVEEREFVGGQFSSVRLLEIIFPEEPEKCQLIEEFPLTRIEFLEVLEDNQMIMIGQDFKYQRSIYKIRLPKQKIDRQFNSHPLIWTTLFQKTIENIDRQCSPIKTPLIYNPSSMNMEEVEEIVGVEPIDENDLKHMTMHTFVVIQNLVFSFCNAGGEIIIKVMKINTENANLVKMVDARRHFSTGFGTPEWRAEILTQLFLIAKRRAWQVEYTLAVPPVIATTSDPIVSSVATSTNQSLNSNPTPNQRLKFV